MGEENHILTVATALKNPEKQPSGPSPDGNSSKSVAFDVEKPQDRGYETDDSDSSVNNSRKRSHRTSGRHHSSVSQSHRPSQSTSNLHARYPHLRHGSTVSDDSESTIDLPDRFDGHGRRLPQNDDMSGRTMEDLLQKFTRVFI